MKRYADTWADKQKNKDKQIKYSDKQINKIWTDRQTSRQTDENMQGLEQSKRKKGKVKSSCQQQEEEETSPAIWAKPASWSGQNIISKVTIKH